MARQTAAIADAIGLELLGAEQQLNPLPGLRIRDGVAAALEAEQPVTRDDAGGALDHEVRRRRQRPERATVTAATNGHDFAVGAVHAPAGDVLVPVLPRQIRLLVTREAVRTEKALTDIGDVGLDLAFRLRPVSTTQPHGEAVMVRGGQRLRVKDPLPDRDFPANMAAHNRLGAVIEQLARDPAEVRERGTMARPERHEILRTSQRAKRVPRMAENHVKAIERQLQPRSRADRLLMRPVDLRLVPGSGLKPLLNPRLSLRARPLHIPAHRVIAALKTVVTNQILVDPCR